MKHPTIAHQAKIGIACPHCQSPSRIRSSRSISNLLRQLYCQCQDVECGFTFGVEVYVTHGIAPSRKPNPALELRMEPPRKVLPADNDRFPPQVTGPEVSVAANDDREVAPMAG